MPLVGLSCGMPDTASPKVVATRWFEEVWNLRAKDLVPELMHEDAVGHLEGGQEAIGPTGFYEFHDAILGAFPDLKVKILRATGDDDDAGILWEATAVHSGDGLGLPATGRPVAFRGASYFRVTSGKIVEGWDSWNQAGLFAQLAAPQQ
jgi:steroid delta-isomerase-like uncharacterized protein